MRTRRSLYAVASAIAIAGFAASASAWTPIDGSRPVWCTTVPYSMNAAGSADLGAAMSATIVQMAMDDWSRVSCTGLSTSYSGTTSRQPGSYEGTSTVGWAEGSWRHGSSAIGVTGPSWGGSCIREADMELNGVNYRWITGPGSGGSVNAYSIILHEGGHYYGLGHSSDSSATMYFAYTGGIASLNSDDQAGICALYPGSGGTDCTTTGCPSGQMCEGGECVPIMGDGTICAPCATGADCGSASDFCLRYPDGGGYCGRACSSDADCMGDRCVGTSGGVNQCIRIDSSGSPNCTAAPPGCSTDSDCAATERCNTGTRACEPRPTDRGDLGEPCMGPDDCNSGLCATTPTGGICTQSCDWLEPTSCPSGYYCDGDATGTCGEGLCVAGTAGSVALGAPCSADTECASLLCSLGTCAEPCQPGGTTACPDGFVCQVGTTPGCGACRVARRTGESCEMNDDCVSRICAVRGDGNFCTEFCTDASTCPPDFTCEPAGDRFVCAPPEGGIVTPDAGTTMTPRGTRGGCCAVVPGKSGQPDPEGPLVLAALLLGLAILRRRR